MSTMDKKIKQFFASGNKNTSDNELLLTFYCASTAQNAEEFEENLAAVFANLSGVAKLDEEGGRDTVGRAYNFLAGLHHAQLKGNCVALFARFNNDPAVVVENLGDLVARMMLPKSRNEGKKKEEPKKQASDEESDEAPKKEAPKKEAPKKKKEEPKSDSDEEPKKEAPKAKVPVVLPKKSGLPQPDF